ncbi:hypothetical protein TNCV_3672661 [Trichonephila clavipes]|nr:hypothetical protein TNCV_3672661 [Trichonephila clavipes]
MWDDTRLLVGAVGSLMVRASDSRPAGPVSMLEATKYPPSTHGKSTAGAHRLLVVRLFHVLAVPHVLDACGEAALSERSCCE